MAPFGKLGWFFGLIFGTLFGVMFAPRKGKDLRDKIKAERKKGKLGVAPLQDDLSNIGRELVALARDIYNSNAVQDIVEKGRHEVKKLSQDFVGEVHDFHHSRIKPLQREVRSKVDFVKAKIAEGKKTFKLAKKEARELNSKVKSSAKIGKKAVKDIKKVIRKKSK